MIYSDRVRKQVVSKLVKNFTKSTTTSSQSVSSLSIQKTFLQDAWIKSNEYGGQVLEWERIVL